MRLKWKSNRNHVTNSSVTCHIRHLASVLTPSPAAGSSRFLAGVNTRVQARVNGVVTGPAGRSRSGAVGLSAPSGLGLGDPVPRQPLPGF